jgi:hypothetical protein
MNQELQQLFNQYETTSLSPGDRINELLGKSDNLINLETYPDWYGFFQKNNFEIESMLPNPILMNIMQRIVKDADPQLIVDPWSHTGFLVELARQSARSPQILANAENPSQYEMTKRVAKDCSLSLNESLAFIESIQEPVDLFISTPPFMHKKLKDVEFRTASDEKLKLSDFASHLILTAATLKLSDLGIGLFIVPQGFFAQNSIFSTYNQLGISLDAVFSLPRDTFGKLTQIQSYLIVTRNRKSNRVYVAELTADVSTNNLIIDNYQHQINTESVSTGKFVEANGFKGIQAVKANEDVKLLEKQLGYKATKLSQYVSGQEGVRLYSSSNPNGFSHEKNSIYIPLIGNRDVVQSIEELEMKYQNYIQVILNERVISPDFIVNFLNSHLGKKLRVSATTGFIPRLTKATVGQLHVFIPNTKIQKNIIQMTTRIQKAQTAVKSISNEISELNMRLWGSLTDHNNIESRFTQIESKISDFLKDDNQDSLTDWGEKLPFPLASILRSWRAAPTRNFSDKNRQLNSFFEATAEFASVILLSAYCKHPDFNSMQSELLLILAKINLSFTKASFGTWKNVVEHYGRITRAAMNNESSGKGNSAVHVDELFTGISNSLVQALCSTEFAQIIDRTNRIRNKKFGHTGLLNTTHTQQLHEQLLSEVENLRACFGTVWLDHRLIRMFSCIPDSGVFEHEIADMSGSHSEFDRDNVQLSTFLDKNKLYLHARGMMRPFELLPLFVMAPPPESASNTTCYFYSSSTKSTARYVSYHHNDLPETEIMNENLRLTIELLTRGTA